MVRKRFELRAWIPVILMISASCSNKSKDTAEECADPPPPTEEKAVPERTVISTPPKTDLDWCRACVVGPHGFMSCQRVSAESATESRGALKARARGKACEDAGFEAAACPDEKVIALSCKGDDPPKDKTAAGKAMLKALKNSGPLILKKDAKKPDVPPPSPESKPRSGETTEQAPKTPPDKGTPAAPKKSPDQKIPVV